MTAINEPLLQSPDDSCADNPTYREPTLKERWLDRLGFKPKHTFKIVRFPNKTFPHSTASNVIDNRKSNVVTFLPVLLYHEFKQFLSLFYLVLCLIQFLPEFKFSRRPSR